MSVIIKSGASGNLAVVDALGNLNVAVNSPIVAGSNLIGQVEITDGSNILGTLANPVVVSAAPPQNVIVTGTIASSPTANVAIATPGVGIVLIQISDTWVGTLAFEASPDGGTTWKPVVAFPKPSNSPSVSSTTTNGVWAFAPGGSSMFRVRGTAWTSGTATIHLEASQSTQVVQVYNLYAQNLQTYSTCVGTLQESVGITGATQNLGVLSAHVTATAVTDSQTHNTLGFLHTDLMGNLRTRNRAESVLGDLIVIPRLNQLEINFSEGFNPDLITNSSSGSGAFQTIEGTAEYSTGTTTTGRATGISTQQLKYHPGHEWYCKFTASFTTPTDSFNPNYQRVGPYNATDGFYLGFEKTTFCFTQLQDSVANSLPRSSWNGDPCDGSTGSAFTRQGVPEALDLTRINIYRLRGSWFGTAPVQLQVYSPDMDWVALHTFHFPNTVSLPFTFTTNWNVRFDVLKSGSDSTDLKLHSPCVALGTNNDTAAINEPLTDYTQAKLVRSILTGKAVGDGYTNVGLSRENAVTVAGSGMATLDVAVWDNTTPQDTFVMPLHDDYNHNTVTVAVVATSPVNPGAITFEASIDNIHFVGMVGVDSSTGQTMPSPIYVISGGSTKIFSFNVTGFDHFRYRLSTGITGSGTVTTSYLLQGMGSPNVSTSITTGTVNVDSSQGTPNTLNNAWPVGLTDGINGPAAIRTSAATGSDPALVVVVSPNNSVAVTGTFWQATQPVSGTVAVTQSTSPWITQDSRFARTVSQDGSGNVGVNVQNFPATQTVSGSVTAQILDAGGSNKVSVDASGRMGITGPVGLLAGQNTIGYVGVTGPVPVTQAGTWTGVGITGSVTNLPSQNTIGYVGVTGPVPVTQSGTWTNVGVTGSLLVYGNKTNNGTGPGTNNLGTLPAVANASTPTWLEGNQVALSTDLGGRIRTTSRPAPSTVSLWSHAIIAVTGATGAQTLIAGATGATIRVMKLQFTTDRATNISFLDNTPTTLSGIYVMTGNGSSFADSGDGEPLWITGAGKGFQVNLSSIATLGGDVWYTQS